MKTASTLSVLVLLCFTVGPAGSLEQYPDAAARMVTTIENIARSYAAVDGMDPIDSRVLEAMRTIPRHEFVPLDVQPFAYEDRPLPIGNGQTISQPFIVAVMTHLLDLNAGDKVLEIGTGSGYQAAVLAALTDEVFTIEIVPELGERARTTLERLGFGDVQTRIGDGYDGWEEQAPFEAIIVTAAPDQIPPPLIQQLAPGGRLVVPVGSDPRAEVLTVLEKGSDGTLTSRQVIPVRFVPFTRSQDQ